MLGDQALSTGTNFGLSIVLARSLEPREFGAFGLAYATYLLAIGFSRSFWSDPVSIRHSGGRYDEVRGAIAGAAGGALVTGLLLVTPIIAVASFLPGVTGAALFAIGLVLPGLLLQDAWRIGFLSAGRPAQSAANDLAWAVLLVVFVSALMTVSPDPDVRQFIVAWGLAGSAAGLLGCRQVRRWPDWRRATSDARANMRIGSRLALEFALTNGSLQVVFYALALFASLTAVASIRAAQILLGPVVVLMEGTRTALLPEMVRVQRSSPERFKSLSMAAGVGLAASAALVGVGVMLLPDSVGGVLLGDTWPLAVAVLPLMTLNAVGRGFVAGASVGLRALGAADRLLHARLILAPVTVVTSVAGAMLFEAQGAAGALAITSGLATAIYWRELTHELGGGLR